MGDGTPSGAGQEIQGSQSGSSEQTKQPESAPISRGRQLIDKLKSPFKGFWEHHETNFSRRKFLQTGAVAAGVTGVVAAGGLVAAEKSMPQTTIDKNVMVGDQPMHFSAQEFNPKEGELKDPEEVVLFLVGAPMRSGASVTWAHPEDLANQFKVKAYEVDARPIGAYSGNAVDLEVEAIRDFLKVGKFKKVTIVAHSIGVPKAFELAAILEQRDQGEITVNGIVANNPVGLYKQDKLDILKRYKEDGDSQGLEENRNPRPRPENSSAPRHESLPKVISQLAGSMMKDFYDTGLGYKKFLEDQINVATEVSPYLTQVHAPVLFLLSSEDKVVQIDKILPKDEILTRLPATDEQGHAMRQMLIGDRRKWDELSQEVQEKFGNKDNFVRIQRQQIAEIGRVESRYMREKYVPNATNVMVIEASKYPTHIATTVERSEESAHVGSRIFDWMARQQKAA